MLAKENIKACFVQIVGSVIAKTLQNENAKSTKRSSSLDETRELSLDKEGILETDFGNRFFILETEKIENSDNNYPSVINQDSDWVSVFGNGKSLNCVFLTARI